VKIRLDVPLEKQEDDYSCTPVCMKMVLEYIRNKFSEGLPDLDSSMIAKIVKTKASADEGGTTFENVELINEELNTARPSLRFVAVDGCELEDIKKELANDHPVISWVMMPSSQGDYPHAKVVTGIDDDEKLLIFCNDPVYEKEEIPLRKFFVMWGKAYRILIKVEIGEEKQRSIKEWIKSQGKLGDSQT
jgi:predicted double-glycine peptidase